MLLVILAPVAPAMHTPNPTADASARSLAERTDSAPEPGYDVPRARWRAFLARFVERHGGTVKPQCRLTERHARAITARRRLPLHGVRYSTRVDGVDEILVTLGEPPYMLEPYFLVDPVRIRVEQPTGGELVLRFESRTGVVLVLAFDGRVGRTSGPLTLLD